MKSDKEKNNLSELFKLTNQIDLSKHC